MQESTTRIIAARALFLGITAEEFLAPYIAANMPEDAIERDIRIRHAGLYGGETPERVEEVIAELERLAQEAEEARRIAAEKAAEKAAEPQQDTAPDPDAM